MNVGYNVGVNTDCCRYQCVEKSKRMIAPPITMDIPFDEWYLSAENKDCCKFEATLTKYKLLFLTLVPTVTCVKTYTL